MGHAFNRGSVTAPAAATDTAIATARQEAREATARASQAENDRQKLVTTLADTTDRFSRERATLMKERDAALAQTVPQGTPKTAFVAPTPGTSFHEPGHSNFPEMVVVPEGQFVMGSESVQTSRYYEKHRSIIEGPSHPVQVKSFAMGVSHVTVAEFRSFAKATNFVPNGPCQIWNLKVKWGTVEGTSWENPGFESSVGYGDNFPVTCVSWEDASRYIAWLNETLPNKPYHLPTEEQWEYAARAPNALCRGPRPEIWTCEPIQAQYSWSRDIDGNETGIAAPLGPAPMRSFPPNGFGLRDMAGNLWQWVWDCFDADAYARPPSGGRPIEAPGCRSRVARGGSWFLAPSMLRSGFRLDFKPSERGSSFGFRVARNL